MIHPSVIHRLAFHGSSDMGDVGDKTVTRCRWSIPSVQDGFALVDVTARNSGGSAGRADLVLRRDHRLGPAYDFSEQTFPNFGNGVSSDLPNIKWVLKDWELRSWMFLREPGTNELDELVAEWTNPNSQDWAIEVGLVAIADIPASLIAEV